MGLQSLLRRRHEVSADAPSGRQQRRAALQKCHKKRAGAGAAVTTYGNPVVLDGIALGPARVRRRACPPDGPERRARICGPRARQGSPSARPAAAHAADGRDGRPKMRPRSCSKSARAALLGREAAPTACRPRGRLRGGGLGRAAGDARAVRKRLSLKLTHPMASVKREAASPAPSAASSPAARGAPTPPPLCAILAGLGG